MAADPQDEEIEEHEHLDAHQIMEDAADLFGAEDRSEPVADADAPPPG